MKSDSDKPVPHSILESFITEEAKRDDLLGQLEKVLKKYGVGIPLAYAKTHFDPENPLDRVYIDEGDIARGLKLFGEGHVDEDAFPCVDLENHSYSIKVLSGDKSKHYHVRLYERVRSSKAPGRQLDTAELFCECTCEHFTQGPVTRGGRYRICKHIIAAMCYVVCNTTEKFTKFFDGLGRGKYPILQSLMWLGEQDLSQVEGIDQRDVQLLKENFDKFHNWVRGIDDLSTFVLALVLLVDPKHRIKGSDIVDKVLGSYADSVGVGVSAIQEEQAGLKAQANVLERERKLYDSHRHARIVAIAHVLTREREEEKGGSWYLKLRREHNERGKELLEIQEDSLQADTEKKMGLDENDRKIIRYMLNNPGEESNKVIAKACELEEVFVKGRREFLVGRGVVEYYRRRVDQLDEKVKLLVDEKEGKQRWTDSLRDMVADVGKKKWVDPGPESRGLNRMGFEDLKRFPRHRQAKDFMSPKKGVIFVWKDGIKIRREYLHKLGLAQIDLELLGEPERKGGSQILKKQILRELEIIKKFVLYLLLYDITQEGMGKQLDDIAKQIDERDTAAKALQIIKTYQFVKKLKEEPD